LAVNHAIVTDEAARKANAESLSNLINTISNNFVAESFSALINNKGTVSTFITGNTRTAVVALDPNAKTQLVNSGDVTVTLPEAVMLLTKSDTNAIFKVVAVNSNIYADLSKTQVNSSIV
jgi:hypothetical protein